MLQNPELHYLDNAATTMVAPEVADVIDKAMREHWANPSSLYGPGARSEEALNAARAAVARTLGCKSRELYFTSCGSESNNLALLGAVRTRTLSSAASDVYKRQAVRATIWLCWARCAPAPLARASWCPALSTPVSSARWKSWRSRAMMSR